ncbi:MAG: NYN domain-containing protein [Christensenellaceae bacterium]|nr:NYN domain-containing protein [Christensenellaceae bacterium]
MSRILFVDGYNVIGAWQEAEKNQWPIDECRDRLANMLEEYGALTGQYVVLVFDGYKGDRLYTSVEKYENIEIVYTKKYETADSYIEKAVYSSPVYNTISVATSDAIQQTVVLNSGATRISSRELLLSLKNIKEQRRKQSDISNPPQRDTLASRLPKHQYDILEKIRRSNGK